MATAFYDSSSLNEAIKTAFDLGVTAGAVNPQKVDVTYHIEHTHGSYCYPLANPTNYRDNSYSSDYYDSDYNSHYNVYHHRYSCQCSVCGRTFNGNGGDRQEGQGGRSSSMVAAAKAAAENTFYAHLTNGRCTAGGIQCGKTEGLQDITDVSILGAGDNVISATIDF